MTKEITISQDVAVELMNLMTDYLFNGTVGHDHHDISAIEECLHAFQYSSRIIIEAEDA